jgi:hypothetical protein
MKRFLIISSSVMVFVLLLAVALFVYVQIVFAPPQPAEVVEDTPSMSTVPNSESVPDNQPRPPSEPSVESGPSVEKAPEPSNATIPVPTNPIPLSSLPLTNTQKELLRSAGIDPETFIITPEMITCAKERLGEARFAEIVAGDAPGPTEVFSLLRCL